MKLQLITHYIGWDNDNDDDDDDGRAETNWETSAARLLPPHTGGRFRNNLNPTSQLRSLQHMPLHTLKHTLWH